MSHNQELAALVNKYNEPNQTDEQKSSIAEEILQKEGQWADLTLEYLISLLIIVLSYHNTNGNPGLAYNIFTKFKSDVKETSDTMAYCRLIQCAIYSLKHQDGKDDEILHLYKEFIYYSCKGDKPNRDIVLYSFRNEKEYTFKDLEGEKISFSNPITFNDPLDTILYQWLDYRIDNAKDSCPMLLKRASEYIKARCFVSIPQGTGSYNDIEKANSLMWAHYANSHKGICIRYRFKPEFFTDDESTQKFITVKPMDYDQNSLKIDESLSIDKALYAKNPIWKYEDETRIVYYNPACKEDYGDVELGANAIVEAIYLGVKCSDETREHVQRWLRGTSIPLYQMHISAEDAYKLVAKRIG